MGIFLGGKALLVEYPFFQIPDPKTGTAVGSKIDGMFRFLDRSWDYLLYLC